MSELFDEDPRATPTRTAPPRRSRALVITAVVLVVLFFGLTTFSSIYTDRLWYASVDYAGVFSTMFWTRTALFCVFGVLMAAVVAASMYVAYRFRPAFRPPSPEQSGLDRYRETVTPIRTWLVVGVSVVIGIFAGTSGAGQWRTYLLWRNGGSFGDDDPYFGRDKGFYVFDLPWWHFLTDFAMAALTVALIAAAVVHYLYGGIRLQSPHDRLSGAAQAQLSVLLGLFVLAKGVDYYLDRFDLVNSGGGLITGMTYTDDNAVLPAKNILVGIALICAVLFFLNVWRRTWLLPSVGLALMVLSAILLGMIWPGIVQQFQVKPSEADKEEPYIARNIEATRAAYDLEDIEVEDYTSEVDVTGADLAALDRATSSIPLVDPQLVRQAFEQEQQVRAFYSVAEVLDVDRYPMNGTDRALVLGVRELDQAGISEGDRNWSNLHTVYTHGNGIIAAYANQRPDDNSVQIGADEEEDEAGIQWAEGNETGQDALTESTGGFEDRVYFGELSPSYSIVGKAEDDDRDVELSLPGTGEEATLSTYDGGAGVSVGSTWRRLLYAIKYGEPNFLLSERVNDNSRILYNRNPRERVEKVAPWLTIDGDPYPAVVDGRILWILDGYTTTDRYPLSERESFQTMTDDSLDTGSQLRTIPTDEINYMRNAVKATVDAYTGEVLLYEWDTEDPILQAWRGAFPDTVLDREEIPDPLLEHLRYPEDLFKVQRYQFARYHVTEAGDFYQGQNRWEVPEDPNARGRLQPPYRLFVDDGGEETFSLTSVFVPFDKNNLSAFVSVNADATDDDYGRVRVLQLPNEQTRGPGQVANDFASDPDVADAVAQFNRSGARPVYGNLLTLPVGDGLMYVQPVYAIRELSESSFPVLRYVLVKYGDDVGFGETLRQAMANLLGVSGSTGGGDGGEGDGDGDGGEPTGTIDQRIQRLLEQAEDAFDEAEAALREGDLAGYEELVEEARGYVAEAIELAQQRDAGKGDPEAEPSESPAPSESAEESPSESPSPSE